VGAAAARGGAALRLRGAALRLRGAIAGTGEMLSLVPQAASRGCTAAALVVCVLEISQKLLEKSMKGMLPNLVTLRLAQRTGARNVVCEINDEKTEQLRQLQKVLNKISKDEIGLVIDQLGRGGESRAEACQQITSWCSLNKAHHEACAAVNYQVWVDLIDFLFPPVIRETYALTVKSELGVPSSGELASVARMSLHAMCYGTQLAQHVQFEFEQDVFCGRKELFMGRSFAVKEHAAAACVADSLPGKADYVLHRDQNKLFDVMVDLYFTGTLAVLPWVHEADPEVSLYTPYFNLVDFVWKIAYVLGCHVVSCYERLRVGDFSAGVKISKLYWDMHAWCEPRVDARTPR